jgi:LPXTG-motif cell wall-anchored protein
VVHALGQSIIVRTAEGEVKQFTQSDIDKRGVKIMREGKPAGISDFRANDRLTATIITSKPPHVMTEREVQATLAKSGAAAEAGAGAPAAAAPPAPSTAPTAGAAPSSSASTVGSAPRKLPKTASPLPVIGLTGLVSLLAGLGLTVRRRRATH